MPNQYKGTDTLCSADAEGQTPASAESAVLEVEDLTCGYAGTPILEGINFEVCAGEVCCILGPNGVGKTTLFKSVLGTLPVLSGQVRLCGTPISQMSRQQVARKVGYVPQAHTPPFPFTVLDVVEMGRTAHLGALQSPSAADRELSLEALNTLGIAHLHDRLYTQISGGERQMVLIARALAQQADLLVMDEPTASLDFGNQIQVLSYVRQLANAGLSVVMTTHAPDHVFWCADKVVAVHGRQRLTVGRAQDVVTDELLSELYDVEARIVDVETGDEEVTLVAPKLRKGANRRAKAIERFLAKR